MTDHQGRSENLLTMQQNNTEFFNANGKMGFVCLFGWFVVVLVLDDDNDIVVVVVVVCDEVRLLRPHALKI